MCVLFFTHHGQTTAYFISLFNQNKSVYKQDLRQSDNFVVKRSECVCASTAAVWCLMLFKSGLRKSQSCCWPSLFGAPGVSMAPGHETYRIDTVDK